MDPAQIETVSELIEAAYDEGRFVFIIGNGGSGANASHLCEDLAKCTLRDFESQKRLKVLSLTDNTAGDHGLGQRRGLRPDLPRATEEPGLAGRPAPGHLGVGQQSQHPQGRLLGQRARARRRSGFTGFSGGKLKTLAHHNLHAAVDDMGIVESLHLVVFHWIIDDLLPALLRQGASPSAARRADRMAEALGPGHRDRRHQAPARDRPGPRRAPGPGAPAGRSARAGRRESSTRSGTPSRSSLAKAGLDRGRDRRRRASASVVRSTPSAGVIETLLPDRRLGRFPAGCLDRRTSGSARRSSSRTTPIPPAWPRPASARASVTLRCST